MIPKKIHYCWFSGEAYPAKIQNCIESWKRVLPDYEFILWDREKALSIGMSWVRDAIQQKKWAFAADAVRLYAIYNEGGIYLDSDVEVLKSFNPLLERESFFGYENGSKRIEGAVFGAAPHNEAVKAALDFYLQSDFSYNENTVDQMVLPNVMADAFKKSDSLEIFNQEYFSPKSFIDGKIHTTEKTFCIHHFESGWRPQVLRNSIATRQKLYATLPRPLARLVCIPLAFITNIRTLGFGGTIRKIFKKIF